MFWTFSANIWDVAAGILLIREAGGAFALRKATIIVWIKAVPGRRQSGTVEPIAGNRREALTSGAAMGM